MTQVRSRKRSSRRASNVKANSAGLITRDAEFDLLRRLSDLTSQLRGVRETEKALKHALRLSMEFFHAPEGAVIMVPPGREEVELLVAVPQHSEWDGGMLLGFLRGRKVNIPSDLMLSRIRRYGRMWGALAVRTPGADFRWDARQAFSSIGVRAADLVDRIDQERVREVRARIDQKVIEQIRPQDLFYKILHGIRSLIGYDHSAALLICNGESDALEVVAEQIAWRKAKSQKVGRKLPATEPLFELLSRERVFGFDRDGETWRDWTGLEASELADLLDYNRDDTVADPPDREGTMLCAPLKGRDGVLGVLKVAAVQQGTFGRYEADLISQFLPQAAIALHNLRRAENLEQRVIEAERKNAMADLARGVSHDVNNALGAVLPLVQELKEDIATGSLDPKVAGEDLREIERSLLVCRRIFSGMLSFARGAGRNVSEVYLHHEIDTTLAIIRDGLERRKISVQVDVPPDLPPLRAIQADIEQLLLNLIGNARDAMQAGGTLSIRGYQNDGWITLAIEDTGCGIPPSHMAKIREPFFTTKPSGTGLGLAICQSIVSQTGGRLHIHSVVGKGTTVQVTLPAWVEPDA